MTTSDLIALAKKNPLIVICVVLTLGLAGVAYFRSGAIADAEALLEKNTATAQKLALNVANSAQLDEQFAAVTAANKTIESRLIRSTEIGINQQYFYKLEIENKVKLMDLRQGNAAPKTGNYIVIPFTVAFQGDFRNVMGFLRALENGPHFCRVQSASLTGGRIGPVTLSLNLELLGHP